MTRLLAFALVPPAVFVTAFAAAAPVPKEAMKPDDTKAILGRWQGNTLPNPPTPHSFTFRFSDDGTCGITNVGAQQETPAEYTLDPAGTPKRMKWLNGRERAEWRCVYELDGDTLRVGFVPAGKDVPDSLDPKPCFPSIGRASRRWAQPTPTGNSCPATACSCNPTRCGVSTTT